ncbi:glycosyltransferase aer61 [Ciona intestinalis]
MLRILVFLAHVTHILCYDWSSLNLVESHVPYVFANNPGLTSECKADEACPYRDILSNRTLCWGFEKNCDAKNRFGGKSPTVDCDDTSKDRYWHQADFGYLRDQLNELDETKVCDSPNESSLHCTKFGSMCRARKLYLDLRDVNDGQSVVGEGGIGGFCKLDANMRSKVTEVKRSLSTWGEQLQHYTQLDFNPWSNTSKYCDVIVDKPMLFVQLDFGGNMYHHFCDFFNIYLTQMANSSWFGTDVQIVRWDLSYRYGEVFRESWDAFTNRDHVSLREYMGKRICITDAMFSFLPRTILGLFYNTPVEVNCRGSSLFKAFSEHFLHRMGITSHAPTSLPNQPNKIRVTLLERGSNPRYKIYRQILNVGELGNAIRKIPGLEVNVVEYHHEKMSFKDQLLTTHNSDIMIGMHGAGLTHFLFLPPWAVAFELYNCGDIRCYRDLPRLRGVRYITWENESKLEAFDQNEHPQYGDQPKFWNYKFDVPEFVRLVLKARSWVLEHDRFAHLRHDEL